MKPEERLQRAVASYLTVALPGDAVWSAIGHGGGGRLRGAMLNGMGVKSGCPDLFIAWHRRMLWLELKSETGKVSKTQAWFHAQLRVAGHQVMICRSIRDVQSALEICDIPVIARVAA